MVVHVRSKVISRTNPAEDVSPRIVVVAAVICCRRRVDFSGGGRQVGELAPHKSSHHTLDAPHLDWAFLDDSPTYGTVLAAAHEGTVPDSGTVKYMLDAIRLRFVGASCIAVLLLRILWGGEPPHKTTIAGDVATGRECIGFVHEVQADLTCQRLLVVIKVSLVSLQQLRGRVVRKYVIVGRMSSLIIRMNVPWFVQQVVPLDEPPRTLGHSSQA